MSSSAGQTIILALSIDINVVACAVAILKAKQRNETLKRLYKVTTGDSLLHISLPFIGNALPFVGFIRKFNTLGRITHAFTNRKNI